MITEWTSLTPQQLGQIVTADDPTEVFVGLKPRVTFVINGLSWPATERFDYALGDRVRWRVINLSSQSHPLHLHGFYFDVDSLGNGQRDTMFDAAHRRRVVTQLAAVGRDDDDDVDAGARGQLAVPLPHHAPRVARSPARRRA